VQTRDGPWCSVYQRAYLCVMHFAILCTLLMSCYLHFAVAAIYTLPLLRYKLSWANNNKHSCSVFSSARIKPVRRRST